MVEYVVVAFVARYAIPQVGCNGFDVFGDDVPHAVSVDHEFAEVFVEDIADDADHHVRFAVQEFRCTHLGGRGLALDRLPALVQAFDVLTQVVFRGAFCGCAHDDAGAVWDGVLQDRLQAAALTVGQFARNAGHLVAGDVHEEAAGQRDLRGQARALVPDGVLCHLDEHRIAGVECDFDSAGFAVHAESVPVDFTGVQHGVAALADVDEGGFHAGQHVLHATQVDVADERGLLALLRQVVFNGDAVFGDNELSASVFFAHDHGALNRFATGQEFSFRDDGAAAPSGPAFPTALTFGFYAGRTADTRDFAFQRGGAAASALTAACAASPATAVAVVVIAVVVVSVRCAVVVIAVSAAAVVATAASAAVGTGVVRVIRIIVRIVVVVAVIART